MIVEDINGEYEWYQTTFDNYRDASDMGFRQPLSWKPNGTPLFPHPRFMVFVR